MSVHEEERIVISAEQAEEIEAYADAGGIGLGEMTDEHETPVQEEAEEVESFLTQIGGDADWAARFARSFTELAPELGLGLLEETEMLRLTASLARSRGEDGFTLSELTALLNWANQARLGNTLFEMILKGGLDVDWNGEDATFARRGDSDEIS